MQRRQRWLLTPAGTAGCAAREHGSVTAAALHPAAPKTQEGFWVRAGARGLRLAPATSEHSELTRGIAPALGHSKTCWCLGSVAVTSLK